MAKTKANGFQLTQKLKQAVFNILTSKAIKLYAVSSDECTMLVVGRTKSGITRAAKKYGTPVKVTAFMTATEPTKTSKTKNRKVKSS